MASKVRVFVPTENIIDNKATITGGDASHISRVMRLGVGDIITVCDMKRNVYDGEIMTVSKDCVTVALNLTEKHDTELPCMVTVYQGVPKGDKLETVIFKSYDAPVLEEQLDMAYYNTYDNIPGAGTYVVELNNGDKLIKTGLGIVNYKMWGVPSAQYYDVFFGANFMNNIGHIDRQLVMIRPSNGQDYETFIYDQYFDMVVDGAISATDETLAAIAAIAQLPRVIKLSHEPLVIAAREAYNKIATRDQQALVTDYATLVSAENKIQRLKDEANAPDVAPDEPNTPNENPNDTVVPDKDNSTVGYVIAIAVLSAIIVAGAVLSVLFMIKIKKRYDRPLM
jgi:hypothetical protein